MFAAPLKPTPITAPVGLSLIELLVCLCVLGLLSTWASPTWERLQSRLTLDTTREQLLNDLQNAQVLAVQQGLALQMAALHGCAWASTAPNDWGCGWQLRVKSNAQVLRTSALHRPVRVVFSKSEPLDISPEGDLGLIGDRWVLSSASASLGMDSVVCLNSASRLRWQTGASCG